MTCIPKPFGSMETLNQYAVGSKISNIDKYIDRRLIKTFIWKSLILSVDFVSNHWCIAVLKPFHTFLIRDITSKLKCYFVRFRD